MDSRRRSLERAALSTGSPDDEARVLLERLRAEPHCKRCQGRGEVPDTQALLADKSNREEFASYDPDRISAAIRSAARKPCPMCAGTGSLLRARVECAAFAGHEAARLALACDHSGAPWGPGGCGCYEAGSPRLEQWLASLSRWGAEAQVAAALGAARVALPVWEAAHDLTHAMGPSRAMRMGCQCCAPHDVVEAVEAWLEQPCELAVVEVEHACDRVGPQTRFVTSLRHAFNDVGRSHYLQDAIEDAARLAGEPAVREAAAAAVRRWALGGEA